MRTNSLAVSLLVALLPVFIFAQEPTWRHQSLSDWQKQLQSPNIEDRHAAAIEFMFMPIGLVKESLPQLTKASKDESGIVAIRVHWTVKRCDADSKTSVPELIALLETKVVDDQGAINRRNAVETLGNLGNASAVPALIRQLGVNDGLDHVTALALCQLGKDARSALPALKKLIRSEASTEVLGYACMAIAALEPEAPEVKQAIVLLTPRERFRKGPAPPYLTEEFLVRFPELTIQHVVPLLEDQEKLVRRAAARILAAAGSKAKNRATGPLQKALADSEVTVRVEVVRALHAVAPEDFAPAIPILITLLGTSQINGFEGIKILRPRMEETFPLLLREFDNANADYRFDLVTTLVGLRYDSEQALPRLSAEIIARRDAMLVGALADPSLKIRRGSAAVARQLGPQASAAIPALLQLTKDLDPDARLDAIEALVAVDPSHHSWLSWLPALEKVVVEKHDRASIRAITEIRQLGPAARSSAPTLLEAVQNNTSNVRTLAAVTLVFVDVSQKQKVLPALLEEFDKNNQWQWEVVDALSEFGPEAKGAVPTLQAMLAANRQYSVRLMKCVRAMTRVDRDQIPACRKEIEALLKSKKSDRRAQVEALVLLPEWGVEARPLAPILRELATDENGDHQVTMAAAVSLVLMAADDDQAGINRIRKVVQTPEETGKRKFLLEIAAQLGPLAKPLAPELRPLAADAVVGELAKEVLAKIDSVKE